MDVDRGAKSGSQIRWATSNVAELRVAFKVEFLFDNTRGFAQSSKDIIYVGALLRGYNS